LSPPASEHKPVKQRNNVWHAQSRLRESGCPYLFQQKWPQVFSLAPCMEVEDGKLMYYRWRPYPMRQLLAVTKKG